MAPGTSRAAGSAAYAEAQALLPEVRDLTLEASATVEHVRADMIEQGATEEKIREQIDRIVSAFFRGRLRPSKPAPADHYYKPYWTGKA